MLRRTLHLMLVFAVLANQAAICGAHSHHDSELVEHSARSHVHFSGHSNGSGSHQHHEPSHRHDSNDQQTSDDSESALETSLPGGHDSDALYFGDQNDLQSQSNRLIVQDLDSAPIWFVAEQPLFLKPIRRNLFTRAGPFSNRFCAIYLQTSRLLI